MKYDVEITAIDHNGRGIGRIEEKIVFVPKTLIGDKCTIKITKNKKNYYEAKLIKILKEGVKREKPLCPYFDKCGGCDLMHMSYTNQLRYKEEKVKNILMRYANVDKKKIKKIIPFEEPYFYRNKINFKVRKKIGFYEKKSYDIVEVERCVIARGSINQLLEKISKTINLDFVKEITIRVGYHTADKMIIFHTDKRINVDALKDKVQSIYFYDGRNYILEYGQEYIVDKIGNFKFKISPSSFFQVNTIQAEELYEKVREYANLSENDIVLDLYSGTGTIGMYISRDVKKVIGIEINKDAVKDAKENKILNKVENIEFQCGDASKLISKIKEKIDVVIVDPPRAGLDIEAIKNIKRINSKRLIYVSCNPITLARDLEKLSDRYEILEITPVDMFCHTYHVECVCVLKLK